MKELSKKEIEIRKCIEDEIAREVTKITFKKKAIDAHIQCCHKRHYMDKQYHCYPDENNLDRDCTGDCYYVNEFKSKLNGL